MGKKRGELPRELVRARERFETWRESCAPRSRIPQQLWALAIKLSAVHGLYQTASTLKLDYYSLKKRIEETKTLGKVEQSTFLELPSSISAVRECIIELQDEKGVTIRVHLKGYDAADILTVGSSFRT